MYFVFFGNDTVGVRQKAHELVSVYEDKGFIVERIDGENYGSGVLTDAAGATSLFGGEQLYIIDTPSTDSEFYEDTIEHLPALKESSNTFVIIEGALQASEKKKFTKYAEKMEEVKAAAGERFNTFALADALAKKDKKTLWLLVVAARQAGVSAEEVIGILWWQLKTLRLAAVTKSAPEAGMKDFPYNKAKRALGNFSDGELETLSHSVLRVYHDGHAGKTDIDFALEQFVLSL